MSEAFSTCMKIRDEKKREQQNVTTKREVLTVTEDSESQRMKRIEKLLGKEQPSVSLLYEKCLTPSEILSIS